MSLKRLFLVLLGIQFILVAVLMVVTLLLFQNQNNLHKSQRAHFNSYLLADEFRQSSDDLTLMARAYVLTGNAEFKRDYQTILDIRNGKNPRPVGYNRIYWDFKIAAGKKPRPDGETISLQDLMIKEGFTQAKIEKLTLAQRNSDKLVKTEMTAMNAVNGLFDDGSGNFTVKKKPDRDMAIRIMFDEEYLKAKAEIMKPVDDFYVMLEKRTATDVANYEHRSIDLLWVSIALILIIMGMFLISFFAIERQITKRFHSEESLRESEKKYRALVDGSPDGIIIYSDGKIVFANPSSASLMRASNVDELIGKSTELVHPAYREKVINRIKEMNKTGKAVPITEERFLRFDGTEVDVEVTAAPIIFNKKSAFQIITRDITERIRTEEEIKSKVAELEKFNRLAVGREIRIIELKQKINELSVKLGLAPPHKMDFLNEINDSENIRNKKSGD